jgi:hypothetical protein
MRYLSFEDMCEQKGIEPDSLLPDVSRVPTLHRAALIATTKLFLLANELNEGWKPDWNDDDEYKYYPWFDLEYHKKDNPTGFQFDSADCRCTAAGVGSRLCFRSRSDAEYAGKTYINLYRTMMLLE